MSETANHFRFVSTERRVREDRRFVAGKGHFVADIDLPNMSHVALVTCPTRPRASCDRQERGAGDAGRALRARRRRTGRGTLPLMTGLDTPNVPRRPLAVDIARYSGEWVAAVVADSRALAEDAAEAVESTTSRCPSCSTPNRRCETDSPLVHQAHGSNVLLDKTFVWGEVEKDFAASAAPPVAAGQMGTLLHGADRNLRRGDELGPLARDPRRLGLDPDAALPDQIGIALKMPASSVRVHYDVDVGGSYGVKRGIKHTVLCGYLARRLGFPVRLIEDRLENMRGGDAHGPERLFDVDVAFDDDGVIRSMKMRALENVGAYAGRSPFQLGKPIGAIVGPYRIKSVQYRAVAVVTNKTTQEAVRGFGQAPTNVAIERMMDEVANALGLDPMEVRRRNLIRHEEFPYTIPSGTTYDSGDYHAVIDKVLAHTELRRTQAEARPAARARACSPVSVSRPAWSRPAATPPSKRCSTRTITTSTFMDSCRIDVDGTGAITATMHTTSSGQGP